MVRIERELTTIIFRMQIEMDAKKMTKVMKKNKEIKGKKNKYKRNLRNRILLVKNKVDAFQEKKILFS